MLSELVSDDESDELGSRASDFFSVRGWPIFFLFSSMITRGEDFFGASPSFSNRSISLISSSSSYSYASMV